MAVAADDAWIGPGPVDRPESVWAGHLIHASPIAIVGTDVGGLVIAWNPAAAEMFGWSAGQVLGRPPPLPALRETLSVSRPALTDAGPGSPVQLRCRHRDGRMREVEIATSVVRDSAGQVSGVVGLATDITDREQLHRRLQHQAHYDSLTGLPNRDMLAERTRAALTAAAETGAQTGLLLIDLDKFKDVNDSLGHVCGDQLLAQIGPRLITGTLREHDLVARLSGDEFAILLPDVSGVDAAVAVAERILTALHSPFVVGRTAVTATATSVDVAASVGIAVAPDHGADPAELLSHADTAMYEAKSATAGVAVYQPGQRDHAPTRFGLLGELRRALEYDELVVHYQPKVDVASGALHGVEALVRWQHPTRGLLGPAEFIPLAETTGLIGQLTTRVLDLALAQARSWADAGHPVPVSVNLSARSLHDRNLPGQIVGALAAHQLPAHLLWLEITESAIMHDPTTALAVLQQLADHGIRLSLDDFGTGYSSMAYLRQLPVAELKVDRTFVTDLAGEHADEVLVRSAVDLGHNLGLTVVAEGVEDAATLAALGAIGCDVAQGYYFARPMPADQLETWLTRQPVPSARAHADAHS